MSGILIKLTSEDYTSDRFRWYEIYANRGDIPDDNDVVSTAEFNAVSQDNYFPHVGLTPGDIWYHWVRAVYDGGATKTAFAKFGPDTAPSNGSVTVADITDASPNGRSMLTAADYAAMRSLLSLGSAALLQSDTDGTLAANSDTRLATQKAVKTYADRLTAGPASATSGNLPSFNGTTGKVLQDSGIALPAVNTWTPQLSDSSGHAYSHSDQVGFYFRFGKLIIAFGYVKWTGLGSADGSMLRMNGLPAASKSTTGARFAAALGGYISGLKTGGAQAICGVDNGVSYISFRTINDNAAPSNIAANTCATSGEIQAAVAYLTD